MALEKKYSDTYFQELLKKFISGEITEKERFLLEKRAIDDPFLFDAMQGYSTDQGTDHAKHISSIRNKLLQKKKNRKNLILRFWLPAAAASLLLFFSISSIIKNQNIGSELNSDSNLTASNENIESGLIDNKTLALDQSSFDSIANSGGYLADNISPTSAPTTKLRSNAPSNYADTDVVAKESRADYKTPASSAIVPEMDESIPQKLEEESVDQDMDFAGVEEEPAKIDEKAAITMDDGKPEPRSQGFKKSNKREENNYVIDGLVRNNSGEPLIGVSINAINTNENAITDTRGKFKLSLPAGSNLLNFNYVGYTPETISVENNNQLEVVLEESQQLDAVQVIGYSSPKQVEPVIGFDQYRRYIMDNLQRPSGPIYDSIRGKVIVQFYVNPDGLLDQFEILQSLCNDCDEEAIRLLKEGGKWRTDNPKKPVQTQYSVDFDKK